MSKIELLDLPYDCLYYFVYNWCTVTVMHRKIKRINVFFYKLVQYIINSSKYNPKFIKNQEVLLHRNYIFYLSELECRKRWLNMHSSSLKEAIKKRFKLLNCESKSLKGKSETLSSLNTQIEEKTRDKMSEEALVNQLERKLRSKSYFRRNFVLFVNSTF